MWSGSFSSSDSCSKRTWVILPIGLLLLVIRTWPRLLHPEVWQEDGTYNLPGFFQNGLTDLLEPVNGYLIVVPKMITMLSVSISITQYPMISTFMACGVMLVVFYIVATAPIRIHGGILLAAACMLLPSNPEVFGLPLYSFWWISILLFVVVFWNANQNDSILRAVIIIMSSLSSPVCIATLPLLWTRACILRKNRREISLTLLATSCVAIQVWTMIHSNIYVVSQINIASFYSIITKFIGSYAIGNIFPMFRWYFGLIILSLLIVTVLRDLRSPVKWGLAYLLCATILMSISRLSINYLHHAIGSPRYFFFPFIILSWFLLQIALTETSRLLRMGALFILCLSILNAIPVLDRKHDDLNWATHLASCPHFQEYELPVHIDGNIAGTWALKLTKQQCNSLLDKDPFSKPAVTGGFPFRVIRKHPDDRPFEHNDVTVAINKVQPGNEWLGADPQKSHKNGIVVLGSFMDSGAGIGSLTLKMKRGDKLLYRSGLLRNGQSIEVQAPLFPVTTSPVAREWVQLDFSNDLLPDEFSVIFSDQSTDWHEWSAIMLKAD